MRHGVVAVALAIIVVLLSACAPLPDMVSYEAPVSTGSPSPGTSDVGTPTVVANSLGTATTNSAKATTTISSTIVSGTPTVSAAASPTQTQTAASSTPKASSTQTGAGASKRLFLGYYVPYDASSWHSLEANWAQIDLLTPQWVSIDACGNISSQDDVDLVQFAKAKNIRVLPSLFTVSGWMNHIILTDEATSARAIKNISEYVREEGYAGLDLDLEGVEATDRAALTLFVERLGKELHSQGKLLSMALPAKTYDATTGWAGAYDYAALAPHVDYFTVMAYAYTTASTQPGSTSPKPWVEKVAAFTASQIPPSKALLGLAFYGYDWNLSGRTRAVRAAQAEAIASAYQSAVTFDGSTGSAVFNYTAQSTDPLIPGPAVPAINHEIKTRARPTCGVVAATSTPAPPTTPQPTATVPSTSQHIVWFENAASVRAKLDIASKYGLAGAGGWRLGQEDAASWLPIYLFRTGNQ